MRSFDRILAVLLHIVRVVMEAIKRLFAVLRSPAMNYGEVFL
jgi:hypothetical protein